MLCVHQGESFVWTANFIVYTVKGYDSEGSFEGTRRYNDFYHLRSILIARMPGIYIPPIPPKKAIGNKTDKFLEERGYFLQRFLQNICKIKHVIKSDEFSLFSRPSGDIDRVSSSLEKFTPDFYLKRLQEEFGLEEELDDDEVRENQ